MKLSLIVALVTATFSFANAAQTSSSTKPVAKQDVLVKFKNAAALNMFKMSLKTYASNAPAVDDLGVGNWLRVQSKNTQAAFSVNELKKNPNVEYVQPNYKLYALSSPSLEAARAKAKAMLAINPHILDTIPDMTTRPDNPDIPAAVTTSSTGADPLAGKQWGMKDIGVEQAWAESGTRGQDMIVGVIDTGVDYTHEDLVQSMWRNPGEMGTDAQGHDKSSNKVDDDKNGFVDDVVGWDFVDNDNKPFDAAGNIIGILFKHQNPGHGTHCAGNVAARANNATGIHGVAGEAKVMALRFIGTSGEGDTAGAVKAMAYAMQMGAKVLSNSWGSIGEDPSQQAENKALRDGIQMVQAKGGLFIAAAGNGDPTTGIGYSNDDNPSKMSVPASYEYDNIVSVAAIDSSNNLGKFSNWGVKTVDIGAPGVAIFSTVVQSAKYTDTILDMFGLKATWDGTSMATPHVAGAAALYWSKHPTATWSEVKDALLKSAVAIPALQGKVSSGGKLNVEALMKL